MELREGERLDDLMIRGLSLIQNPKWFCFGMDAVLLSDFADAAEGERVIDLGTGTGILPLLLWAKTRGEHFTGLEIIPEMADMARRSVAGNHLEEKIDIVEGDIREAAQLFGRASFQAVTCNPPYIKAGTGLVSKDPRSAAARHEVLVTMEDVAKTAAALLVPGGRFYLVHRPRRLAEILRLLGDAGLTPKRLAMVHPYAGEAANMFLLEAVLGGGEGLSVEAPIIVYDAPGRYTADVLARYGLDAGKE